MTDHVTIIAEAGVNHNGDLDLAMALVDAAAAAGADAVKFQTFDADKLAQASAPKAAYQQAQLGAALSQHQMLKALELPRDWHRPLIDRAVAQGIAFISTAFDDDSLAFLQGLGLPFFKVPSGELTNGPLLWRFARHGAPLVISTGMATLGEIEQALAVVAHALTHDAEPEAVADTWRAWATPEGRAAVAETVTLLHCTSQYPAPMDEVNLRAMRTLAEAFQLPVGYSDHTSGNHVAVAAVALGARVIEKHVTTDRTLPGPDHAASIEPDELADLVRAVREVSVSLGSAAKAPQRSEWDTRKAARQRLVAARAIGQGQVLTRDDLTTARAATGRPPMDLWALVGTPAPRAYAQGEAIEP